MTAALERVPLLNTQIVVIVSYCLFFWFWPIGGLIVLFVACLFGIRQSLQSLFLLFLSNFANPAFLDTGLLFNGLRWIVFLTAVAAIHWKWIKHRGLAIPPYWWLWIFGIYLLLQSLYVSPNFAFSLYSMLMVVVGVSTCLLGFSAECPRNKSFWDSWISNFFVAILLLSIPTWFYPSIGWRDTPRFFQGILDHPQAFGVVTALFVAFWSGKILMNEEQRDWKGIILAALGWFFMLSSNSRTAITSVIIGFLLMVILSVLLDRPSWTKGLKARLLSRSFILGFFVVLLLSLVLHPLVLPRISDFVLKKQQLVTRSDLEALVSERVAPRRLAPSRTRMVRKQVKNFLEHPLWGIGFGIPSEGTSTWRRLNYDPVFQKIPISGGVEKSLLATKILEETGLVGAVLFTLLIGSLAVPVLSRGARFADGWLFLTCLLTNIGEATLFSLGGIGLLLWLLIAFSAQSANPRQA